MAQVLDEVLYDAAPVTWPGAAEGLSAFGSNNRVHPAPVFWTRVSFDQPNVSYREIF
jgi:hypothetical protein